jgi:hypothetical protein
MRRRVRWRVGGAAADRVPIERALADGDDPPFDERELDIAAGTDEKHCAASDAVT